MQEKSSIKERILEVLDFKDISKYQFYKESKITRGVLDKSSGLSESNITKFIAYLPEINLEWLITGEGKMLKKVGQSGLGGSGSDIEVANLRKEVNFLRAENNALKDKLIACMEQKQENQDVRRKAN